MLYELNTKLIDIIRLRQENCTAGLTTYETPHSKTKWKQYETIEEIINQEQKEDD